MADIKKGQRLLSELESEIIAAFDTAPEYGSAGIEVFFREGAVIRIDVHSSQSRKLESRGERSNA